MRIDLVRELVEMAPLPAELRRFVCRPQLVAVLPLDIVDDPPAIEAAMQADRDEARLARHEAGPLAHQGQRLGLLARLRLDDRDLSDRLIVDSYLWHGRPRSRRRRWGA